MNSKTQPSERKDGFGTEGIGEGGDEGLGRSRAAGGGTGSHGTGGNKRGGHQAEGAFGENDGAKGRRSEANKQGLNKGDGAQD